MPDTAYKDPYNFEPLEPALHDCLIDLCNRADEEGNFEIKGGEDECKTLDVFGYVHNIAFYWGGDGQGFLTEKGKRYPKDYEDWKRRRNDWEASERKRDKASIRHGYLMAIVGAIAGSLLTLLVQLAIGLI